MAETAGKVSAGLAGWRSEQLPMNVPIYPTATNQYLYDIDESKQSIYNTMKQPLGESEGEREGQGMAAAKQKGEMYVRTNTAQRIQSNGEAGAAAIEYTSKLFFSISPLAKSVEAKYDVNTMVQAYNKAWNLVNSNKFIDLSDAGSVMNWTEKQVQQFKVDVTNFVVDAKLPINATEDYGRLISSYGTTVINATKEAHSQKPLNSDQ